MGFWLLWHLNQLKSRTLCHPAWPQCGVGCWIRFIVCESDSATALRLIKENNNPFHPYSPLISQIQRLVTQQWDVSFTHTLREGNTVADWLAKTGATHDSYFIAWRECPAQLQSSVLADSLGVSKLRL